MHKLFSRSHVLVIFFLIVLSTQLSACGAPRLSPEKLAAQLGPDEIFLIRPGEAQEGVLEEAANIEAYFQYRFDQMKDGSGTIPDGALMTALEARAAMETAQKAEGPDEIEVAGIGTGSWTAVGPGNVGGRIRAVLPIDASTVFIGGVAGGIWKTTNCCTPSTTWTAINDFMANLAISSLIVDPTNPNVMYAGTGEGFSNADAVRGAGVFKSTDGGTTWTQLASTNTSSWYYVNRLAISPNGVNLIAATGSGLYHSTDGGVTWAQRLSGNWKDVRFDPTNSNNAVAAGSGYSWYTTGGGGSGTWTAATGLPASGRIELAYAPSNPTIVYASVEQSTGAIYKSTDSGHTYTVVNAGAGFQSGQGWYDNTIWVNPTDPNNVVVGGLDLYQSTNGAITFTKISDWTRSWPDFPASPHADHHALVSIPGSSTALLNGNDGGLYYTSDIATAGNNSPDYNNGWVSLNNNLGITQFYGVAGNANGVVYGGAQDNGVTKYTPGAPNAWTFANGGDGGESAADPTNPNYLYNEYTFGKVNRSSDGGTNTDDIYGVYWTGSAWVCRNAPYRIDDACNTVGNFIAPILLDPNNPNRLLVGGLSLWATDDARTPYVDNSATAGPQWAAIKPSIGSSAVNAIAVAPGNSNIIWVGYKNGQVDMTTNGGSSWNTVTISGNPGTMVGTIAIDRNNNNVVYVGFTGFGANRVWRTADGGTNWTNITSNLPQAPVYALAINPSNSAWLYVGTEIGIFASEDTGGTWNVPVAPANGDGPANVAVFDLQWMGGGNSTGTTTLIAGTHGRGAYLVDTIPAVQGNTYADPALVCGGNSPCYATIKGAIDNVIVGGTATLYAGTYAENVSLNKAATVSVVGNITINDVSLYNGSTWNAGSAVLTANNVNIFGGTWNAGSSTLTVNGDWAVNGTFNVGTGTVVFAKNGTMTLSDATQVGGTLSFCNLTIGANTLVDVTDDFISAAAGGSCTQYIQNGQLRREAPMQTVINFATYTFKDGRNRDAVILQKQSGNSLWNTNITITSNLQPPATCGTDPFPGQSVLRQYTLSATGGTPPYGPYRMRLYFSAANPNEANGNTTSAPYNLAIYQCNGSAWTKFTGTGGSDANGVYIETTLASWSAGTIFAIGPNTVPPTATPTNTPTPTATPTIVVTPGPNGGDGPGGVGTTDGTSSLTLWLRADQGLFSDTGCTITATSTSNIACWQDQSGNLRSYTQSTPANQPNYFTNVLNNQAVLRFNGVSDYLANPGSGGAVLAAGDDTFTYLATWMSNINSSYQVIFEQNNATLLAGMRAAFLVAPDSGGSYGFNGEANDFHNASPFTPGQFELASIVLNGNATNNVYVFDSGTQFIGTINMTTQNVGVTGGSAVGYKIPSTGEFLNGDLPEVIVFSEALNDVNRILVENYMSARYGIALNANDVYDGDTSGAGDFDLDVAGIGQIGGLQHTQAHSAGMIVLNGTFLTENGDWLLFGHRTPTNSNVITELPSGGGWDDNNDVRWARHWYIDVTDPSGNTSTVNIIFDFSEAGMGGVLPDGPASNYRLLKRTSAVETVSFTDITALSGATVVIAGDQVQFWGVDVAQLGSNFTLGSVDVIDSPTALSLSTFSARTPATRMAMALFALVLLVGLGWASAKRAR